MSGQRFLIDAAELEYDFSGKALSNSLVQELSADVPSVSYLNFAFGSEISIPSSIFGTDMAPLQALVKYLKEEKSLTNKQISLAIKRDVRTIWLTYSAVRKKQLPFDRRGKSMLPLGIFSDGKLSVLEAVASYMRNAGMSYADIARQVSRDQRTIWTVVHRAAKKLGVDNERKQ